jgi:adenylate cyclase
MNEIERKFLVRKMPDISNITPVHYERYFLPSSTGKEIRISKVDNVHIYEEKDEISEMERTRAKKEITRTEFDTLKANASGPLIRDKYMVQNKPKVVIQVYEGRFQGLNRAEVEFETLEEAQAFKPMSWMGKEITKLPIGRDSKLIRLAPEEFRKILSEAQS